MKISACTIVKNEAKNIAKSIFSYQQAVDEIIIVDTGSTDNTVQICEQLGAKVLHYKWNGDFAAAKNLALDAAIGDWIIFLDADEWFEPVLERGQLKEVLRQATQGNKAELLKMNFYNIEQATGEVVSQTAIGRIFKHHPDIRFEGRIHEEIKKNKGELTLASIEGLEIYHSGYSKEVMIEKCHRNLELLNAQYVEGDIDGTLYFYLCRENYFLQNFEEADRFCKKFLEQQNVEQLIRKTNVLVSIYAYNIQLKLQLSYKYTIRDIEKAIELAVEKYPQLPLHYYLKGVYYNQVDSAIALENLEKAIELHFGYKGGYINNFAVHLPDTYYKLAVLYDSRKEYSVAVEYIVKALQLKKYEKSYLREFIKLVQFGETVDIILALNTLYDMNNGEDVKYLTDCFLHSKCQKAFLYFAKKYNQDFDGQDETTYKAMLLLNQADQVIETAVKGYEKSNLETDRLFIVLGIFYAKDVFVFNTYKQYLTPEYAKILYSDLVGVQIGQPTQEEIKAWRELYVHVFWHANDEMLSTLEDVFEMLPKEAIQLILELILQTGDYSYILKKCYKLKDIVTDEGFLREIDKLIAISHFYKGNYEEALRLIGNMIESRKIDFDYKINECLDLLCYTGLFEKDREKANALAYVYKQYFRRTLLHVSMLQTNQFDIEENPLENMELEQLDITQFESLVGEEQHAPQFYLDSLLNVSQKQFEINNKQAIQSAIILLQNQQYKDYAYYTLGELFNRIGKFELAAYCYQNAFKENPCLASKIIDKGKPNSNYRYHKIMVDKEITHCPICGEKMARDKVVSSLLNPDFTMEDTVIKQWNYCEKCQHKALENVVERPLTGAFGESEDRLKTYEQYFYEITKHMTHGKVLSVVGEGREALMVAKEYGFEVEGIYYTTGEKSVKSLGMEDDAYYRIYDNEMLNGRLEQKYDVITVLDILNKTAEPKELIQKLLPLLGKAGKLIVSVPVYNSAKANLKGNNDKIYRASQNVNLYSKASIIKLLTMHQLTVEDYRVFDGDIYITASK